MKNFKFFILLACLFLAKFSQAACFPTSYTSENYKYTYSNLPNAVSTLDSLWLVRFDLTDTDVCSFEFLRGDYSDYINQTNNNYVQGRFYGMRSNDDPLFDFNSISSSLLANYTSSQTTIAVTTTGNNFNTSNPACWCDRTSNSGASTCSITGLSQANNQVPAHSLTFKKCAATNTTVPVFIKIRWVYKLKETVNNPTDTFEYCPKDIFRNLGNPSEASPFGDEFFGPGTTTSTLCQRVFASRPTCVMNIPSQVTLPTIKPSSTVGVRQESKKPITVQLINCVNNRSPYITSNAFPKVTLSDSNGTSTDCYLKNMASTNNGGNSSTNNTVIALSLNQDFSNEICLLDYSASRNNVLTFGGAAFASSYTVQTYTFSQTIWAALRVSGNSPSTEVGSVRSKLMLKLDYD